MELYTRTGFDFLSELAKAHLLFGIPMTPIPDTIKSHQHWDVFCFPNRLESNLVETYRIYLLRSMDFLPLFSGGRLPRLCPRNLQLQGTELSALCACVDAHLALSDATKALSKAEEVAWLHRPFLGHLAIRE